ncbi:SipW-dependent-type signal peptide-containing protein [Nesterenkonia sp. F]|uniref:SipW-dependent-type signal peptide-containing protein n=1 Tax=Nesterenkonia sp. F TaxID=795955 RepID=UPI000255CB6D|nr:SipW-dependent-type signal peptide-containing protein [Nesterenkonia sp. F]
MIGRAARARHETPRSRRRASTKVRALLAGGLVLGVGASTTLAAWNDSEHLGGTVTAGHFTLEGSTDGSSYSTSTTDSPHAVSFSAADALIPGAQSYAFFSVRTAAGSAGGELQVQGDDGNVGALPDALTYAVRTVSGTACDAASFSSGTEVVTRGTAVSADAQTAQSVEADSGSAVNYCLELTLSAEAPNEVQGESATPVWHVVGTTSGG